MRMIDCNPQIPTLVDYPRGQNYVALSYVWGDPPPVETSTPVLIKADTPRKQDNEMTEPHNQHPVVTAPDTHACDSELVSIREIFSPPMRRAVTAVARNNHLNTAILPNRRDIQLPKEILKTIQDAIQVTQSLGHRYLWVDRYCIDQKNGAEKQYQFSRMGDIYAGSQITIFAF
jgi:hypothetical protein